MFENIVEQKGIKFLIKDIKNNNLPSAILFSGEKNTGKLTSALELARYLSCSTDNKGYWKCSCTSCLQHKSLICSNLMILGSKDCSLEISSAKDTFIKAYRDNSEHIESTRYFFIRSIRKLTLRFNALLLEGNREINSIAKNLDELNESLEQLDFPRALMPFNDTVALCEELEKKAKQLENTYLYDSIPINQIRNMEDWARTKSSEGKKTIIIENAERMQNSVRNALLKILEEPPSDCQFILLTTNKNAIIPTVLSRLRNYNFYSRTLEQQKKVLLRVFKNEYFNGTISDYLESFLPIPASKIKEEAQKFYSSLLKGPLPNIPLLVKDCQNFEPRIEFKIFLNTINELQRPLFNTQMGTEAVSQIVKVIQDCWENVTTYNQSCVSALEILIKEIKKIDITYGKNLCEAM